MVRLGYNSLGSAVNIVEAAPVVALLRLSVVAEARRVFDEKATASTTTTSAFRSSTTLRLYHRLTLEITAKDMDCATSTAS